MQNDSAFVQTMLDEAVTLFFDGEPDSAKLILRDLVSATVGFASLVQDILKPDKSLHRAKTRGLDNVVFMTRSTPARLQVCMPSAMRASSLWTRAIKPTTFQASFVVHASRPAYAGQH